ncbi:hypothetical protein HOA55_03370 [archaeon]|jgi:hypothetical protein|nr:hypothetical protein [archaeon]MBT3577388.1 hypothetical protein [archaeon]MBT6820369.1 hypothetical protein [archaeon]MBT6956412.1 hypothetical protein [archaeon]MBT7025183.1 hypothetical protein [archaeon]
MKKKKIMMHSIGNRDKFSYYTFEKTQEAFETLAGLFGKALEAGWELFYDDCDDNYNSKKIFVKKLIDVHNAYPGKSRLDVFYGKDKIFVMIHSTDKVREKINEELGKITKMPKEKKLKKIKKRVKKK